jgi:hypothetical protein
MRTHTLALCNQANFQGRGLRHGDMIFTFGALCALLDARNALKGTNRARNDSCSTRARSYVRSVPRGRNTLRQVRARIVQSMGEDGTWRARVGPGERLVCPPRARDERPVAIGTAESGEEREGKGQGTGQVCFLVQGLRGLVLWRWQSFAEDLLDPRK